MAERIEVIEEKFDYISIVHIGSSASGKTNLWHVVENDGQDLLGYISWYCPWRCYAFTPRAIGDLVFEARCLRDIAGFIAEKTVERRRIRKAERKQLQNHITQTAEGL